MLGHGGGGSAVLPRFPRAVKTISLDLDVSLIIIIIVIIVYYAKRSSET